ncbi:MAG TPA: hypothetical protein VEB68_03540 [Croceibacterium sp.]|nr:hypothetical protein [Croceibacterium sp.]
MDPLTLVITSAGLDKLVDAENGDTDPIVITEIGLSAAAVDAAPTLEALPGEFKRLAGVSGQSVAANVIHMTAQDVSADIYDLRSIALYLADGTLFAAYGQADPIFTKVSIAAFLVAFDVAFSGDIADSIEFGDATFLYPPATETVKGVAELATQPETDAGADDSRIVTPLKLKNFIDPIIAALEAIYDAAIAALTGRTITGAGLATGGGDASANRVITVAAASLAETNAGAIGDKAVVPSGLATILGNIAALFARTIAGGGLVTGGGTLAADRTLTVTKATGAEVLARLLDTAAVTPLGLASLISDSQSGGVQVLNVGGVIVQAGSGTLAGDTSTTVTFPVAYSSLCKFVCAGASTNVTTEGSIANTGNSLTQGSVVNNGNESASYAWIAIGK